MNTPTAAEILLAIPSIDKENLKRIISAAECEIDIYDDKECARRAEISTNKFFDQLLNLKK
jgi:hypothetical protein